MPNAPQRVLWIRIREQTTGGVTYVRRPIAAGTPEAMHALLAQLHAFEADRDAHGFFETPSYFLSDSTQQVCGKI
jgi:hypothetical protein|tara:strand:+ start:1073 stop:1297 length:225 start_codon:yes stop_codon:yes gene_type:complete